MKTNYKTTTACDSVEKKKIKMLSSKLAVYLIQSYTAHNLDFITYTLYMI